MVRLQKMLIDHLGIQRLLAVAGGSMGGMQALEWAVAYPDSVPSAIPIATTARHSAQQIAFNEVGRQAIMADPDWNGGNYYGGKPPARGLAVARMVGHITYMSDESMREKFGRRLRASGSVRSGELSAISRQQVRRPLRREFVPLHHHAMDRLRSDRSAARCRRCSNGSRTRFLVISFTSDWLYPSYQSLEIVSALRSRNCDVAYCDLAVALRPRCVPGGSGGADRAGARLPGQHLPGGRGSRVREVYGRSDYAIIGELIEPGTRVLDLGCGEGELLAWLKENKNVDGARRGD